MHDLYVGCMWWAPALRCRPACGGRGGRFGAKCSSCRVKGLSGGRLLKMNNRPMGVPLLRIVRTKYYVIALYFLKSKVFSHVVKNCHVVRRCYSKLYEGLNDKPYIPDASTTRALLQYRYQSSSDNNVIRDFLLLMMPTVGDRVEPRLFRGVRSA